MIIMYLVVIAITKKDFKIAIVQELAFWRMSIKSIYKMFTEKNVKISDSHFASF